MPHGERQWPDLSWTMGPVEGTGTAASDYGVYERRVCGTKLENGGEHLYEASFDCRCCGSRTLLGHGITNHAAYRACVDHHHMLCERASKWADIEEKAKP